MDENLKWYLECARDTAFSAMAREEALHKAYAYLHAMAFYNVVTSEELGRITEQLDAIDAPEEEEEEHQFPHDRLAQKGNEALVEEAVL